MRKPILESYIGHWNSDIGIPMSNIGIPTWVFQLQPRNSEAREPTTIDNLFDESNFFLQYGIFHAG